MEMNNQRQKYNPLKDGSFWVAFVLGGGITIPYYILQGMFLQPAILLNAVFLIGWIGWIIFKKGKKWSLIIGFLVAAVLTAISFYPINKIDENRRQVEMKDAMEEWRKNLEEMKIEMETEKSESEL